MSSLKGRRCLQQYGHSINPISCLVFCAIVKSWSSMFLTSKICVEVLFESESSLILLYNCRNTYSLNNCEPDNLSIESKLFLQIIDTVGKKVCFILLWNHEPTLPSLVAEFKLVLGYCWCVNELSQTKSIQSASLYLLTRWRR